MSTSGARANWFADGGAGYARFRPDYPPELADHLARACARRRLAVDVGCGNGQLTTLLGAHFEAVVGVDPSADQIANARAAGRIRYVESPAERLPLPGAVADLVTAAQAAHWFDLPAFYREVRRVAAPGAVLALVTYDIPRLGPPLDERFLRFYRIETAPFWSPERDLVDSGYAALEFPFEELAPPRLEIRKEWTLAQFLGYIATWSAVRKAQAAGHGHILEAFAADLAALWKDAAQRRAVTWPIHMRIGRIAPWRTASRANTPLPGATGPAATG